MRHSKHPHSQLAPSPPPNRAQAYHRSIAELNTPKHNLCALSSPRQPQPQTATASTYLLIQPTPRAAYPPSYPSILMHCSSVCLSRCLPDKCSEACDLAAEGDTATRDTWRAGLCCSSSSACSCRSCATHEAPLELFAALRWPATRCGFISEAEKEELEAAFCAWQCGNGFASSPSHIRIDSTQTAILPPPALLCAGNTV
jgi:hypothetical protein